MAWQLVLYAAGALWLGTIAADASEATVIADRAGFLIGHAQRCGVEEVRLERAAVFGKQLIAAFSLDDDERQAAQTQFAERILASGLAKLTGDPLPSCSAVRSQLVRLEQHRRFAAPAPANRGVGQMAQDNRSDGKPARSGRGAPAKPAEAAKPATTAPEELTAERRAALELRRTAQQQRGRPPSI